MMLRPQPSLKIIIPLLCLFFAALLSSGYLYYSLPKALDTLEARYIRDAYRSMSTLQGSLEYLLRKRDIEGVRREVTAVSSDPEIQLILLVDDSRRIIASSRLGILNKPVQQSGVPIDWKLAELTRHQLQSHIVLSPDKASLLGYSAVSFGAKQSQLRPTRVGLLIFKKDLSQGKQQVKSAIINQTFNWMYFVGILALLNGWLFHQLITRRVATLLTAVESLARGDYSVRARLSGRDELARLSQAFDKMADVINTTQQHLRQDIIRREKTERCLSMAAAGVSEAAGDKVFETLVAGLARTMSVEYAFIGRVSGHETIQTFACWAQGGPADNFSYALPGSPCATVVGQRFQIYHALLPEQFPQAELLSLLDADSYAAMPLFDANGKTLGLIAILDDKPLRNTALAESILRIFGARAAGELERHRVDNALRQSEASYRSLFDATEDAVLILEPVSGLILDVNPGACAAYGYSRDEFRNFRIGEISSGIQPYTVDHVAGIIGAMRDGEAVRFEWLGKKKDGSLHWEDVCIKMAFIAGQQRVLAFTRDISAAKQAEQNRLELEGQLRQAQKMEAIGQLTGGIAHDFNNILTSVLGNVELSLEIEAGLHHPGLRKYLNNIRHSGERARDLILQMLTFSGAKRGEPRALSLAPLITSTVDMLRATLPSSMELRTRLDPAPMILSDPVLVEQVLMNLYINARDAMNGVGMVMITLQSHAVSNTVCSGCRKPFAGKFVEMRVSDNGSGMPEETLDRIFEPFYTTKQHGKGSGMGLAMVHGIIHEHGGHICVTTQPGEGSSFRILFPAQQTEQARDMAETPEAVRSLPQKQIFSASILVIDDEKPVSEFMQDLLESRGMRVTAMTDSEQALQVFIQDPGAFDLVITDQTMPKLTGNELAVKLWQTDPDIPVILYTGYSDYLSEEYVKLQGFGAYLKKPVDIGQLLSTIQSLLQGGNAAPD